LYGHNFLLIQFLLLLDSLSYSTESILNLLSGQLSVIDKLTTFFHHRWNLPVMAAFHASKAGLRFVVITQQLAVSRDSLSRTLTALQDMQLIKKNPGYGHPLRPEYILTGRGITVAALCRALQRTVDDHPSVLRKWTAPVILVMLNGRQHFNDIRADIKVSPRALTQTLRLLETEALLTRNIESDYPPRTLYRLTREGRTLGNRIRQVSDALAR
jgi:DNA-binding HxlR family transcriptional regulator